MKKKYNENQLRSIGKTISWRVLLTISHIVNAFIITGSIITGLKIAGLAAVINSILFWLHERIWNIVSWNRLKNKKIVFSEAHSRSISKIISWRIIITINNFLIPFLITGSWQTGFLFLTSATVINMFLFWSHERIWNRISWGKNIVRK